MKTANTIAKRFFSVLLALAITLGAFGVGMLNASAEEAPILAFGETYEGVCTEMNNSFSYRLVLPESGLVTVTFRSGAYFSYITLYDDYEEIHRTLSSMRDDDHCGADLSLRLKAGDYRLTVEACYHLDVMAGNVYGPYTLTAAFESANETIEESLTTNNDRKDTAFDYTVGTNVRGQIGQLNDPVDVYRFELTEPGVLRIELKNPETDCYCGLKISEADKTLYETASTEKEDHQYVTRHTISLIPGIYYLEVDSPYASFPYTFTTSFTPVAETFAEKQGALLNDRATAPAVSLGESYTGFIAENDSVDLYRFTVTEPVELTLRFVSGGKPTDVDLKTYEFANASASDYTEEKREWRVAEPGVYFINVTAWIAEAPYGAYAFILYQRGDTDHNGSITAADARTALRMAVGLEPVEEGTLNFYAADFDCNGLITAADARSILRAAVGLEP